MLLNMSLHLWDVNTEPVIQTQTYHALAEAYFNINEHERALNAGKNCFKLQSLKSKVHFEPFYYARTWDIRRQIEHLSSYAHVVETTAKLVMSRRRKNENVFKMSKDEKCTCKACKNIVFHFKFCKFEGFLLPSSSWLLKLEFHLFLYFSFKNSFSLCVKFAFT